MNSDVNNKSRRGFLRRMLRGSVLAGLGAAFGGAIYFFLRQTQAYIFQPKLGAFACLNSPQG